MLNGETPVSLQEMQRYQDGLSVFTKSEGRYSKIPRTVKENWLENYEIGLKIGDTLEETLHKLTSKGFEFKEEQTRFTSSYRSMPYWRWALGAGTNKCLTALDSRYIFVRDDRVQSDYDDLILRYSILKFKIKAVLNEGICETTLNEVGPVTNVEIFYK